MYLDRDESIILSKQVSLQREIKFLSKWSFQTQLWSLIITGGGSLLLLISLGMLVNNFRIHKFSVIYAIKTRGPRDGTGRKQGCVFPMVIWLAFRIEKY